MITRLIRYLDGLRASGAALIDSELSHWLAELDA